MELYRARPVSDHINSTTFSINWALHFPVPGTMRFLLTSLLVYIFVQDSVPCVCIPPNGAGGARRSQVECINSTRRSFSIHELDDALRDPKKWINEWTPPGFEHGFQKRIVPGGWTLGDPNKVE